MMLHALHAACCGAALLLGACGTASGVQPSPRTYATTIHSMTEGATPPGLDGKAFRLFDGALRRHWRSGDGAPAEVVPNEQGVVALEQIVETEQRFADLQLHIEFRVSAGQEGAAGRLEILLHGCYGIVIADSMNRPQRPNSCGAISDRTAPEAAACLPPGAWQTMDIAFRAPRAAGNGAQPQHARVTVLHNGVLVQNSVDISCPTERGFRGDVPERAPLALAPRSGRVELRNLWVRSLDATLPSPQQGTGAP